ncbi:hypothetical protein SISNIDRAFT_456684 [Sistotremastrum niveocremeum HHB9708]|uniref:F-box domain-containing protein n=1 Tax=Sistotremastrum niveocremeum HHB9708 TaxID=1314777 RepID=A0A164SFE3_9AGAM|nr:hypothetical protein SISNIDRAFT_456684 [Sistotremastrum niveocremeum HHB9708]
MISHTDCLHKSMSKLVTVLQRTLKHVLELERCVEVDDALVLRDRAAALRASGEKILHSVLSASSAMDKRSNLDTITGRLPNETLANILLFYVDSSRDQYTVNPSYWKHLLHVWYSVIRSDVRFWRSINISWSSHIIDRHITLSKDSILRFEISMYDPSVIDFESLLRENIERIGEIVLHTSTYDRYSMGISQQGRGLKEKRNLLKAVACSTTLLTKASRLSRLSVNYCSAAGHTAETFRLPSIRHLSSLTFLDLQRCSFQKSWVEIFPPSLVHIHIFSRDLSYIVAPADILHLIEYCPHLELLDISVRFSDEGSRSKTPSLSAHRCIPARKLQQLSARGLSTENWSDLFDCIDAPLLSEIYIEMSVTPNLDFLPIFFADHMAHASHLRVDLEHRFSNSLVCIYTGTHTVSKIPFKHVLKMHHNYLHRSSDTSDSEPGWVNVLDDITTHFSQVTNFEIDCAHVPDKLWPMLQNMSTIISLDVCGHIGNGLFDALSKPPATSSHTAMALPGLTSLCLRYRPNEPHPTLWHDWVPQDGSGHEPCTDPRYRLLACLAQRSAEGHRLAEVILDPSWLTGYDLGVLRRYVDRIQSTNNRIVDSEDSVADNTDDEDGDEGQVSRGWSHTVETAEGRLRSSESDALRMQSLRGWRGRYFSWQNEY